MKKLFLGFMLLCATGVAQVNAQSTSIGIKAEATMSNFIVKDIPGMKSKMGVGANLGGFVKIDLTQNFALQPELLLKYQRSEMKQSKVKRDFKYFGMEIPVYAMGQWSSNSGNRFFAGVGPYVGYGFSAKLNKPDTKLYKKDVLKPWDFGAKAIIGYEFANGIQINAGYKIGFINAVDKGSGKMLPQAISLGLGYRF